MKNLLNRIFGRKSDPVNSVKPPSDSEASDIMVSDVRFSGGDVVINGQRFSGGNIQIDGNGRVMIDGVLQATSQEV